MPPPGQPPSSSTASRRPATGSRPVVLVAEDDPDVLELVCMRLDDAGFDVARAPDGETALRLVRERSPSLCILDVMMPGLTGLEVTERLRGDPATARLPIILLTARVSDDDVARGFAAGADDYVKKPFSPQELQSRVEMYLGRRGR